MKKTEELVKFWETEHSKRLPDSIKKMLVFLYRGLLTEYKIYKAHSCDVSIDEISVKGIWYKKNGELITGLVTRYELVHCENGAHRGVIAVCNYERSSTD